MLAIVVGLLFSVVVALGIVALVALPNLRQGSRVLAPDAGRAVKRARQQAKQKPRAAVGGTRHALGALARLPGRLGRRIARAGRWIARTWAPFSELLHAAMDRLESRDAADREPSAPAVPVAAPVEPAPAAQPAPTAHPAPAQPAPRQERFDVDRVIGRSSVGRPRPTPPISGPIPELTPEQLRRLAANRPDHDTAPGSERRTLDSHGSEQSQADQAAGSARRVR